MPKCGWFFIAISFASMELSVVKSVAACGWSCGQFLADRALDANWLRDLLTSAGITAVIPPKPNRRFPAEFDRDTYKWRHLIENFFGKLKEYRGIAMRCCKADESFSAFISRAATVIRLK